MKYTNRKKAIIQYLNDNRTITTIDAIEILHIQRHAASQVLNKMVNRGVLNRHFDLNDTRKKFYTIKI